MGAIRLLQPKGNQQRFTRLEQAQMFWRAAYYVRRQRPQDSHTSEMLKYLEREFREIWLRGQTACDNLDRVS